MTEPTATPVVAQWVLCHGCRHLIFGHRMRRALDVCPRCGHHHPVSAPERVAQLADPGSVDPLPFTVSDTDPLEFVAVAPYTESIAQAQARTGLPEAVVCARATIEGQPVVIAAMDVRFLGGTMGTAVGELMTLAAEAAVDERRELVVVTSSGGARVQEGALALMQMAKTAAAVDEVSRSGLLTVAVVADPTFGSVAASFAGLADIVFAEPAARLGYTGRGVASRPTGAGAPPDPQTAEVLLPRGLLDGIVTRPQLRPRLGRLLRIGGSKICGQGSAGTRLPVLTVTEPDQLPKVDPWRQVGRARTLSRPTALDYLERAFTDFQELHGDRIGGDCPAVVAGVAWLGRVPTIVVAVQKGHTDAELVTRNFGMVSPAGYRKAARLMRLADRLGLPVVTLVDTPGAHPGREAEAHGQVAAIGESLRCMASLSVPVVSVIIGEGGNGGALALALANRVLMFSGSTYSVVSPESCASILWKDEAAAPAAARALRLDAPDLLRLGVVDAVIPEPPGGVGAASLDATARLRAVLSHELHALSRQSPEALRACRRARFRRFGAAVTADAELLDINRQLGTGRP
ncbi:carboxyltransferase subunit alpha [Parafrankia sp. FMc2]|uniref:carboxyltransferase subunit alpha n=1 Tax=Parafrankia sp. FMc2 TaxID=3233196 RepID=UPI0034D4BFF4